MVQNLGIYNEIVEFITSEPKAEEILTFRPSPFAQMRLEDLMDKNRESDISDAEKRELEQYLLVEHLMRLAKIRARQRLSA